MEYPVPGTAGEREGGRAEPGGPPQIPDVSEDTHGPQESGNIHLPFDRNEDRGNMCFEMGRYRPKGQRDKRKEDNRENICCRRGETSYGASAGPSEDGQFH